MYTSNSNTISRTQQQQHIDNARFANLSDVGVLCDIHRARVAQRVRTSPGVPLTRGADPQEYLDAETRDVQAFWVGKGYYRWVDGDKLKLTLTLAGAVLSAWRGLYPWTQITRRTSERKAAAILRQFSNARQRTT